MTLPATTPAPPSQPGTALVRRPGQAVGAHATGLAATGLVAVGALAVGALAVGALSIGRLAIGRLALGSGHARRVTIDDLTVVRLRVIEVVKAIPPR